MSYPPSPARPVLFVVIVFVFLFCYSIIVDAFSLQQSNRNNFISDISLKNEKPLLLSSSKQSTQSAVPLKDTGTVSLPVRNYLEYDGIVSYEADRKFALSKFITALKELKTGKRKKVRIAYFGDSIIEGDLISQDLRKYLQDHFGGNGVGFVPVTSIVSSFRETIRHSYSSNWTDVSFKTSPQSPLFLSGHTFTSDGSSTVQYGVSSVPHLQHFSKVYALYGKGKEPLQLVVNEKPISLPATNLCTKELVAENCDLVKVRSSNATPLYGFSFEDETGVYVDNYSFRGISGIELEKINKDMLKQVQQVHDYDLIIFQYGPNLLFKPNLNDFTWYEKPMLSIVEKFKGAFPNASLLVISTADKAFRYNGVMETAIGVEPLLQAQNNFAAAGGVNLWNLYRAMGGHNSMLGWVEGDTAFARKDYTHFTHKGAQRIATMLFTTIMKEYALAN